MKYKYDDLTNYIDSVSERGYEKFPKVVLVNTSDVLNGKVLNKDKIENKNLKGQFKKTFKKGDILFSEIRPINKRFANIDFNPDGYVASTKLMVLRKKSDEILRDYIYYFLTSDETLNYLQNQAESRSGTFPQITFKNIAELKIWVPDIYDQVRIVDILKNIDKKIEVNNKIIANLEEQAQAIFKSWFVDFEPFQDGNFVKSELGMIPEGWEVKEVKDICNLKIGRTPPRKESEWFSDNKGIKWVSIKDMGNSQMYIFDTTEFLTKEAVDKFNVPLVEENTLILSFKLTVGRIAIASEKICTNEAIAQFKNPIISSLYLYFYFKNFSFETLGNTSSIGNAVNSKIIREIRILIPNNEALDDFLKAVKPISDYIRVLLSQNKKLAEIRDTLLPKLMSGEIDVSNIKIKGEEVKNE